MNSPTNLINSISAQTWIVENFSEPNGFWFTENNILLQNALTGTQSNKSGTLLVIPESNILIKNVVLLKFSPGRIYQSGILINYLNNENFCLVLINNYSESYAGFKFVLQEIVNGSATVIHEEKFDFEISGDVGFTILQDDGNLSFFMDDSEIYNWRNKNFIPSSSIGFYTQGNMDSQFKELYIGSKEDLEKIVEEDNQEPFEEGRVVGDNIPINEAEAISEIDIKTPFDPYLQIQPPNAQSQIEFREVFNVPLDSFYVSLFAAFQPIRKKRAVHTESTIDKKYNLDFEELVGIYKSGGKINFIGRDLHYKSFYHSIVESTKTYVVEKSQGIPELKLKNEKEDGIEVFEYFLNDNSIVQFASYLNQSVFNVNTGEEEVLFSCSKNSKTVYSIHGKYLAYNKYSENLVCIVDLSNKNEIVNIPTSYQLDKIYFLNSGKTILLQEMGFDNNEYILHLYELDFVNKLYNEIFSHEFTSRNHKHPFEISQDGKTLLTINNSTDDVLMYNISTNKFLASLTKHYWYDGNKTASFSPNASKIAYKHYNPNMTDYEIRVRDSVTGEILYKLSTPSQTVLFVKFVSETRVVYAYDKKVVLWQINSNKEPQIITESYQSATIKNIVVHPNKTEFFIHFGMPVVFFSTKDGTLLRTISVDFGHHMTKFRYLNNGNIIYGESESKSVVIKNYEVITPNIDFLGSSSAMLTFGISPNGKYYVYSYHHKSNVRGIDVWDFEIGQHIFTKYFPNYPLDHICITDDGKLVLSYLNSYFESKDLVLKGENCASDIEKYVKFTDDKNFALYANPHSLHNSIFADLRADIQIGMNYNARHCYFSNRYDRFFVWQLTSIISTKLKESYTQYFNLSPREPYGVLFVGNQYLVAVHSKIYIWKIDDFPSDPSTKIEEVNFWDADGSSNIFKNNEELCKHAIDLHEDYDLILARSDYKQIKIWKITSGEIYFEKNLDFIPIACWFIENGNQIGVLSDNNYIYTYSYSNKDAVTTLPKFSYLIDFRPKKWYRKFKIADDEEAFQKKMADNLMDKIVYLNNVKNKVASTPDVYEYQSHEEIRKQLYEIGALRNKYQEAINTVFKARDIKQAVVHEVRSNGYLLLDREVVSETIESEVITKFGYTKNNTFHEFNAGIDETITSKGYEFAIINGIPSFREFQPLPLRIEAFDLKDHEDWDVFVKDFQPRLFTSGALTEVQKRLFEVQREELLNFDSSDVLLKKKSEIESQIADVANRISQLEQNKIDIEEDRMRWQRDRQKINSLLNGFNFGRPVIEEVTDLYNKLKGTPFEKFKFRFENYIRKSTGTRKVTIKFLFFKRTYTYNIIINYYTYHIFHQFKKYSSHNYGIRYKHTPSINVFGFISFIYNYSNSALDYLHELMRICDTYFHKMDSQQLEVDADIKKVKNEKLLHQRALDNLKENGLMQLRHLFVKYWNDPDQFGARPILDNVIRPDSDPLADLISDFISDYAGNDEDQIKIDVFEFQGDRYYNQDGLTLNAYIKYLQNSEKDRVALFPGYTKTGELDEDIIKAVIHPEENESIEFNLPIVKFVETHKIMITWNGFSLGELTHTENLFPNERKEISVEKITQLIQKREESKLESTISKTKQTASFEENLMNEFSQKDIDERAKEESYEVGEKSSTEQTSDTTDTESESFSIGASVSGGIGPFSASANTNYNKNKNKTTTNHKKNAFELSKLNKGKTSSKESRESFRKQVSNTIKKVAQETTFENKVEVKVNVSEEFSTTNSTKEVVTLENPNVSRTVNYNFFQLQNNFEIKTILTDVKIVVDDNHEVVKGSGISDVRVYELEEVGKLLSNEDKEDAREILIAAIIARQAFRNYLQGVPAIGRGNGALRIEEPFEVNYKAFQTVFFSHELNEEDLDEKFIPSLSSALEYLKKVPFTFEEVEINQAERYNINTGGYYLDAEIGKMPASELGTSISLKPNDMVSSGNPIFSEDDL